TNSTDVTISSSGGSGSGGVLLWGNLGATIAANTNSYLQLGTSGGNSSSAWARGVLSPQSLTLKNFYLYMGNSQPADGSLVCTIQTGTGNTSSGTDTTISITIPASSTAQLFSDTTHSVTIPAGTWAAIHCVNNSASASGFINNYSLGHQ
ncbi:MAG: hypothetical protein ACRD3S_18120, partial [Terracidiphilus sp.]